MQKATRRSFIATLAGCRFVHWFEGVASKPVNSVLRAQLEWNFHLCASADTTGLIYIYKCISELEKNVTAANPRLAVNVLSL